jgi:hypothetical protein
MKPDNKSIPEMTLDNEDPGDRVEHAEQGYAEFDTPTQSGRMRFWLLLASVGVALSVGYSSQFKHILPVVKNWELPTFSGVSALSMPQVAQKTSLDNAITGIPAASPLDLRVERFSGVQPALPLPPPIDDSKLTQLEKQLALLTARIETLQQTHLAQFTALESQLTVWQQHANQPSVVRIIRKPLRRKSSVVLHKTSPHRPAKNKIRQRKSSVPAMASKASTPGFTLASIDHWGDKTQAVLRQHGQLYTLVPGSTLSGWTVVDFADSPAGVYLVNASGQRRLLSME